MSFFKNIGQSFRSAGILSQLILVNVIIFLLLNLLSNFKIVGENTLIELVGLCYTPAVFITHFWGLFTYMFVHFSLGHLFFNLVSLYFMGQLFAQLLGLSRMFFLYLMGGLAGGVLFLITSNIFPSENHYLAGASPAIMAIIVACGFYAPNTPVFLFLFGQVKVKWVVLALFILTTIIDISVNTGGKTAHIGGALIGMIYALRLKNGKDMSLWFIRVFTPSTKSKLKVIHKRSLNDEEYNYNKADEQRMLDEILDKINRSGYDSLSVKDKETLQRLSQKK